MPKKKSPNLYIIAGPNGVGKTTWAEVFLPEYAECIEFLNADLISKGLSPFAPDKAAFAAGRLLVEQIKEKSGNKIDFAFETTLSGKTYAPIISDLKKTGYRINMFYLWVPHISVSIERIKERVRHGGHNVPEDIAARRYLKSIRNLFSVYFPLLDTLRFYDNSVEPAELVFHKDGNNLKIVNRLKYDEVRNVAS
jgi:predicted ABC-type ATPase